MVPDNFNYLPLHHAIELDAPLELFKLLVGADAECVKVPIEGKLPLHFGIEMRRTTAGMSMSMSKSMSMFMSMSKSMSKSKSKILRC